VKTKRHSAAFSLIEVMCAILVLGVSLVALTQGIGSALRSTKESEIQTAAALFAAGRIELMRADGFVIDGELDGDGDGALSNCHWTESVTSTDVEGLHHVKVSIEQIASGKTIYELETLLFDPPVLSTDPASTSKDKRKDWQR
jgi:prepilin-type N-terminal cleavage/methylation domain-containing protein